MDCAHCGAEMSAGITHYCLTPDTIATFTLSKDKTQLTVIEDGEATHLDKQQAIELSKAITNMGTDLKRLAKRMEG